MRDAAFFRDKARQCRELMSLGAVPEVIEQLAQWAEEFDQEADRSVRRHRRINGRLTRLRSMTIS